MKIEKNSVVSLRYVLSDNQTGVKIEEADETNPLVFLYGTGSLIPEFEQNIAGLTENETFDFSIEAANAYGIPSDENMAVIPKSVFFDEKGEFIEEQFPIGSLVPMSDNEGNHLRGKVKEISDENIIMDFNPPLAGIDLHFVGSVLAVREATKEELEHGHVHGPHGHQH